MPRTAPCPSCAVPRPAAVVNEAIRELAGRIALTEAERAEMARLWSEWQAAVEAEEAA